MTAVLSPPLDEGESDRSTNQVVLPGRSVTLGNFVGHAALSDDCRLCLLDGNQAELGLWKEVADVFVGPDLPAAIKVLRRLQIVMDNRYAYLLAHRRRRISKRDR
jgi:S-DNA-T family DNA segregation ATPase FtsK/SpoIIIE